MKGLPVQLLKHTPRHYNSPLRIFVCVRILFAARDRGCRAACPGMAVPNVDKALLGGTLDVGGDAMEGPMSYSVTEAAVMPLQTVLIGMICPIMVTFPTVIPGNTGAYLFLPLFDASLF